MKKILLLLLLIGFGSAHAASIAVNSLGGGLADDGECTLAEAIVASRINGPVWGCSAGNGEDAIWFDLDHLGPGPYEIVLEASSFQMTNSVSGSLTIEGPGMDQLTIKLAQPTTSEYYFKVEGDQGIWVRFLTFEGFSNIDDSYYFELFGFQNGDSAKFERVRFKNNTGRVIDFEGATGDLEILDSEFLENESGEGLINGKINSTYNQSMTIRDSLFLKNKTLFGLLHVTNPGPFNLANFTLTGSQFIEQKSVYNNGTPQYVIYLDSMDANIEGNYFYNNIVKLNASTSFPYKHGVVVFIESSGNFKHNYMMENRGWNDVSVTMRTHTDPDFTDYINIESNTFYNSATYALYASSLQDSARAVASLNKNVIHGSSEGCGIDPVFSNAILEFGSDNRQSGGDSCVLYSADGNLDLMFMPPGFYGGEYYLAKPSHLSPVVDVFSSNYCDDRVDLYGFVGAADADADGWAECDLGAIEMPESEILTVGFSGDDAGEIHMSGSVNEGYEMTCEGPDDCLWPLPIGQTFSLTANGVMGGIFQGWSGSDCSHTHSTCDITMDGSNETAYADFEQGTDLIFQNGFDNP